MNIYNKNNKIYEQIENADDYNGFNVDGGLVAIVDEKVNKEFVKFRNQFEKKSKADFYNGCLAEIFEKSGSISFWANMI